VNLSRHIDTLNPFFCQFSHLLREFSAGTNDTYTKIYDTNSD